MKPTNCKTAAAVLLLALSLLSAGQARAHAFLERTDPKAGATLGAAVDRVRVWFNSVLEPAFSSITVRDAAGKTVDKKDGRVNPADAKLLEVSLPRLAPGSYRVIWKIAARDGHRATGSYNFVIK